MPSMPVIAANRLGCSEVVELAKLRFQCLRRQSPGGPVRSLESRNRIDLSEGPGLDLRIRAMYFSEDIPVSVGAR